MEYDVIIVGAGPGGASAAITCAKKGLKTIILEKDKIPGMKVCAGGIDYRIFKEFNLNKKIVQCDTDKYIIYSPSRRQLIQENKSGTIYRSEFDKHVTELAVDAGAELLLSHRSIRVIRNGRKISGVLVKHNNNLKRLYSKIVIAADGFQSSTAKSANLLPKYQLNDYGLTVQREIRIASGIDDKTKYIFYGGDISPCGFGWIYPKKDGYTVGIGNIASRLKKGQLVNSLEYFIDKHPIASKILAKYSNKSKIQAACIPLKPSLNICGAGILVVGDAAGHVSPLGGNGIYYSMNAGKIAGETTVKAISQGEPSPDILQEYQSKWFKEHGYKLLFQNKILNVIESYSTIYSEAKILLESLGLYRKYYRARMKQKKLSCA